MELVIFRSAEFEARYSCNYTIAKGLVEEHYFLSSFYLGVSVVFLALYVPCLFAIARSDLIQQSCYKIMLFIGMLDIPGLILSGTITGMFGLLRVGFCSAPKLFYLLGCIAEATWFAQTCSSLLLAINRCMVMTTRNAADYLFKGAKTWLFISIPLAYGTFAFFFVRPVIFSPVLMTWLFNPHFGTLPDPDNYYVSFLHVANNFMVVATIPSIYIGFTLFRRFTQAKTLEQNPAIKKHNTVFYQVLLICSCTTSLGVLYVVMQFIAFPTQVYYLAQFLWITYTGSPTIVYLTLNKNIRRLVFSAFRKESHVGSSFRANVSTVGSTNTVKPI